MGGAPEIGEARQHRDRTVGEVCPRRKRSAAGASAAKRRYNGVCARAADRCWIQAAGAAMRCKLASTRRRQQVAAAAGRQGGGQRAGAQPSRAAQQQLLLDFRLYVSLRLRLCCHAC